MRGLFRLACLLVPVDLWTRQLDRIAARADQAGLRDLERLVEALRGQSGTDHAPSPTR